MKYKKVFIESFGYELPPNVISSDDLENRLSPLYETLRFQKGQLEAITGITERRWWDPGFKMYQGAVMAGRKALAASGVSTDKVQMLVYGGVCRDNLEPATACAVGDELGLNPDAEIYDVSNACLGVLNGMVQTANAIELGHIQAGLVVSCESARQIVELTIERLLANRDMTTLKKCVATLTGGSGAVAVLMTSAELSDRGHRLLGGTARHAARHHRLCWWGPDSGTPASAPQVMETDSVAILENGVTLGLETFQAFRRELGWGTDRPDKVVCHQVGATHQRHILDAIGITPDRDFSTFKFLGNIGTVSLPITAAIAAERGFLERGDSVGFLGIGSGLSCLMLGIDW